jgi:hypothetical protein
MENRHPNTCDDGSAIRRHERLMYGATRARDNTVDLAAACDYTPGRTSFAAPTMTIRSTTRTTTTAPPPRGGVLARVR